MNEPAIIIRLDNVDLTYQPGEMLSGEYRFDSLDPNQLQAVEISVLWYTEGKGDQDLAVHEFWRKDSSTGEWSDSRRPDRFSTALPRSPLSYEGQIVKIRWCVRVRGFLDRGKELVAQKTFQLGAVPPIRISKDDDRSPSAEKPSPEVRERAQPL